MKPRYLLARALFGLMGVNVEPDPDVLIPAKEVIEETNGVAKPAARSRKVRGAYIDGPALVAPKENTNTKDVDVEKRTRRQESNIKGDIPEPSAAPLATVLQKTPAGAGSDKTECASIQYKEFIDLEANIEKNGGIVSTSVEAEPIPVPEVARIHNPSLTSHVGTTLSATNQTPEVVSSIRSHKANLLHSSASSSAPSVIFSDDSGYLSDVINDMMKDNESDEVSSISRSEDESCSSSDASSNAEGSD